MPRYFIEVTLHTVADPGEILAMLRDIEALGSWEADGVVHIYWPEERWSPSVLRDLREALTRLGVDPEAAAVTVNVLPDQDWNSCWAASLHPIRIGRHLRIRQSWNPSDPAFGGIELVIDPKRAFGTGYHATTQLVIEWLEDHIRGGERVLDIGTGSGILAMVAIRLGAASALGVDNDPAAIECAREYAAVNSFGAELELRALSLEEIGPERFDIVVANLDRKTLLQLCAGLRHRLSTGGVAFFSGLQSQDYQDIADAVRRVGGKVGGRREREGWLALQVKI